MAKAPDKFTHESLQDCDSIVAYLQALADGFKNGSLTLATKDEEVALHPHGLLRFRLEANRAAHRSRVILKVSWREDRPDQEPGASSLTIRSASGSADP